MDTNISEQMEMINRKLHLLIKNYTLLQKENEGLKKSLSTAEADGQVLRANVETLQQKLSILQASTGNLDEAEKKLLEKKIDNYISEIDKVITVLSK